MAKYKGKKRGDAAEPQPPSRPAPQPAQPARRWPWVAAAIAVVAVVAIVIAMRMSDERRAQAAAPGTTPAPAATPAQAGAASVSPGADPNMAIMETAKAVMVTVELDLGPKIPSVAEAIRQIERRYQPNDGVGRTFAVLDAYGEPTAEGRLHLSMHVSAEKPGMGMLIFKKTGEVLWNCRIIPGSSPAAPTKNLGITLDDGSGPAPGKGKGMLVDGSRGPSSILDAVLAGPAAIPVRNNWLDGQEREVTFVYSACGCPVKVVAKRVGERTVRTSDLPVIFPDDPEAVAVISRLMGW